MERVMAELIGHFSTNRIKIYLILYGKKPEVFYELPPNIKIIFPGHPFSSSFKLYSSLSRMMFIRKNIKKIKPDSILSFGEYWNSFVLLSLLGLRYPVYISDRCAPNKDFGKFHSLLRKFLYPKARGMIAQTEIAKAIFAKQGLNSNIRVIGNPIRKILPNNTDSKRKNVILTVGRLIDSKHHDKLIELFLNLDAPDWKLIIVGGDALRQKNKAKLQDLVQRHHASERVLLTGKIRHVEDYYLKSKIFAFTSSSEGFPNVIGEALSAGLPVVAFDCVAGPSEMIQDGHNGYLVPLYDYGAFKEKLRILMTHEGQRHVMANNAADSIQEYTPQKIGKAYHDFIMQSNN